MLYTNLYHLETARELERVISENTDVLVVCGRMDPGCVPAYRIAEELEKEYDQVQFCDMEFDNPESQSIRLLAEIESLQDLPVAIYFKKGMVAEAASGMLTTFQLRAMLDKNKISN